MIDLSKLKSGELHILSQQADKLAKDATIAFWLQYRNPEDGVFHTQDAGKKLQEILDLLGLEVVSK